MTKPSSESQLAPTLIRTKENNLNNEIYALFPKQKASEIFTKPTVISKIPFKADDSINFKLQYDCDPQFSHGYEQTKTIIAYILNSRCKALPSYLKEDQDLFSKVFDNFRQYNQSLE